MKKAFSVFLTLFTIITILFFILRILPGGPFDEEQALAPELKKMVEAKYHLDQPVFTQYFSYLGNVVKGDLGESYRLTGKKVTEILADTLPATFLLGLLSLLVSYIFGIALAMTSLGPGRVWWGRFVQFFANAGSSMPTFLAGPLLIMIFSFWLDWLPPALWDGPSYYILPVLALSLRPMSLIIRLIRSAGLESIQTDYVRTAQAKGVSEKTILFKHVLRNSLIPLISISGSIFAQILSGGFLVEEIFAVPGVSRHFIESVSNRDYSLVMGLTLVYACMLIGFNVLFDFIASLIDPRISVKSEAK